MDRFRRRRALQKRLRTLPQFSNASKDKDYLRQSKLFLKDHFSGYKYTDWHYYYSTLNRNKSLNYIPDDIFYTQIEPTLNKFTLIDAYSDKISLEHFFDRSELPETVIKIINYKFYDDNNELLDTDNAINSLSLMNGLLVLKPALFNGGGKKIIISSGEKIAKDLIAKKEYSYGSYIIQKIVKQHKEMKKFHPLSLNTCRLMTAVFGSKIVVLSAFMRMGMGNSRVDNVSSGGLCAKICEGGKLSEFAIDNKYKKYYSHPDSNMKFEGFVIPNYKSVVKFCTENHKRFIRFCLISWDIGINENGNPVFIEYNLSRQGIEHHQFFNGPLFGEHTEELLKLFRETKKSSFFHNESFL